MRLGYGYVLLILVIGGVIVPAKAQKTGTATPGLTQLEKMTDRFAPTPMRVDTSRLSSGDQQALVKLIEAARLLNDAFMRQMWSGNAALYSRLQKDTTPLGKARLHYFWLNKGPWSDIDDYKAFLPGVPPRKLPGANFYPENMNKEDFESWVTTLTEDQQKEAKGFFSVIRWKDQTKGASSKNKELITVPYSEEYKDDLTQAASLLREAA